MHLSICSVSVLYILLCILRFFILTSGIFQCCILYFTFLVSECSHLPYFSSVSFTLLSSFAHIYIRSISVLYFTLLASCLHIDIFSISIVYILICFSRLWVLASAVFQFCMFYFAFPVSAYWYPQYFSSVFYFACVVSTYWHLQYFNCLYFNLLFSPLSIGICRISVLYLTLLSSSVHIDICSISVLYFTLLAFCLHIDIFSILIVYILICFPFLSLLASVVFQFCIFYFAFLLCSHWHP